MFAGRVADFIQSTLGQTYEACSTCSTTTSARRLDLESTGRPERSFRIWFEDSQKEDGEGEGFESHVYIRETADGRKRCLTVSRE